VTFEIDNRDNILNGLNPQQKAAVSQSGAPLLVLAGAGSGKTKVLTHRIAYMIASGIRSENILAVTFTNKAAKEMKERLNKIVGEGGIKYSWIGTFHSICARILRNDIEKIKITAPDGSIRRWNKNFVIFDENDTVNIVKEAIKSMDLDPKIYVPKTVRYKISESKNLKKLAKDISSESINFKEERIGMIYAKYEELMSRNNALDFDDLLLMTVHLLENSPEALDYYTHRFKHILVDEYQDTNHTQYELIRLLAEGCHKNDRKNPEKYNPETHWQAQHKSLTVVGDVDQSIYSWRGADFKIIIGFQNDYPNADLIKLEQNYRSTANILQVANHIIGNNSERIEKNLQATKAEGEKITVFEAEDELEEAQYISAEIQRRIASEGKTMKDFAILYRTNVQSRVLEESLLRRNIPYIIVGGFRFYDRKEIKDMISYLKAIYNPADGQSLKRIINEPKRAIGATTLSKLEAYASTRGYTLYRTMLEIEEVETVNAPTKKKIKDFVDLMEEFRLAEKSLELGDLVDEIFHKSGYADMLNKSNDPESESRLENIHELIGVATDFSLNAEDNSLSAFLSEISLLSEGENSKQNANAVTMMTLHAAKGLEYPVVFLGGMEEGIFPHSRSLQSADQSQLEEERRLMYVGVTRAEEKLFLTHARKRRIFGQTDFCEPSRFLEEAPRELLTGYYGHSARSVDERGSSYSSAFDDQMMERGFQKPVEKGYSRETFTDGYTDDDYGSSSGNASYKNNNPYSSNYNNGGSSNKSFGERSRGFNGGYTKNDFSQNRSSNGSSAPSGGAPAGGFMSSGTRIGNPYASSNNSTAANRHNFKRKNADGGSSSAKGAGYSSGSTGDGSNMYNSGTRAPRRAAASSGNLSSASYRSDAAFHPDSANKPASEPKAFKIEFAAGDRVKHAKFGEGSVQQVLGSGEKVLYNIKFDELEGKKLLDPKFAKLIKVG
jgi:DNA helicase-2/ATP-dependent DNA helicase PcrA